MEKLPVLNLEYTFDLLWDIKDTDQLKNAWNGCHCLTINTRDENFLRLVTEHNLRKYLEEADSENWAKLITSKQIFDIYDNIDTYIEKAAKYDRIEEALHDSYLDQDSFCLLVESIVDENT